MKILENLSSPKDVKNLSVEELETLSKELREEIRFIESCFLDSPESAAKLTQLRIAKEINPEILAKYNVLKQVEPSRIYHKV